MEARTAGEGNVVPRKDATGEAPSAHPSSVGCDGDLTSASGAWLSPGALRAGEAHRLPVPSWAGTVLTWRVCFSVWVHVLRDVPPLWVAAAGLWF